jgi:hypothetical protein
MRVFPMLLIAALTASASAARAGCNEPARCPDAAAAAASAEPASAPPVLVAELPGEVVPAVAPGPGSAAARVVANLSDGRPGNAMVARPETGRAARADERTRAEPRPAAGSESSSVWLMLFAGLAFAGFVVAKRSRG